MVLSNSARRRGIYAVSAIDLCSRAFGDANLGAIRLNLETYAGRLAVLADDRNVGQVDRRLFRDDAALLVWVCFWWRLTRLTPRTRAWLASGRTSNTSPVRPLSRPDSTMTLSPLRILAAITAPPAQAK